MKEEVVVENMHTRERGQLIGRRALSTVPSRLAPRAGNRNGGQFAPHTEVLARDGHEGQAGEMGNPPNPGVGEARVHQAHHQVDQVDRGSEVQTLGFMVYGG